MFSEIDLMTLGTFVQARQFHVFAMDAAVSSRTVRHDITI